MTSAQSITDRIRTHLKRPGNALTSAGLAAELSSACNRINARLQQIESVIDNGDEYQAIALAESRPPIIDEVKALKASDILEWSNFCEENQLEVQPDLNEKAIQKLSKVYSKGISPNHRLYKEFRDAILAKKDDSALSIITRIVRLNSSDSNAQAELKRLENKQFLSLERSLATFIERRDEAAALETLDQIEVLGQEDKCVSSQSVQEARQLRKIVRAKEAKVEIEEISKQLPELINDGQWLKTGEIVARIDTLGSDNDLEHSSEKKAQLDEARTFFHKHRDEALRRADFQAKVRELETLTLDAENLSQARGTLNLIEARSRLLALNRQWQIVESYTLPVDPVLVQRVSRIAAFLKTEIARLLKRKRIVLGSSALLVAAVLGLSAYLLLLVFRASDIEKQLARGVKERSIGVVSKLVDSTKKDHPREAALPSLTASLQRAENWLKQENQDFSRFQNSLTELHQELGAAIGSPKSITEKTEQIRVDFDALPKEFQTESRDKYDAAIASSQRWLEKAHGSIQEKISAELDSAEKDVLPNLSLTRSPEVLSEATDRASELLEEWKVSTDGQPDELKLNASTTDRVNAIKYAFNSATEAISEHRRMVKQLDEAKTFEEYQTAVFALKGATLVGSPLVEAAAIASVTRTSPSEILEQVVFPNDPLGWKEAQRGPEGLQLKPDSIVQAELRTLGPLLKGDKVKDVFVATVQGKNAGTIYSSPSAIQMIDIGIEDNNGRKLKKWIGSVYNPKDGVPVVFMKKEYSNADYTSADDRASDVVGIGKSIPFEAYQNMKTDAFISSDGSILRPVMAVIDDLMNTPHVDLTYAGYVLNTIYEATKLRPYAWGLQFSPDCRALLDDVHTQLDQDHINIGDWLVDERKKSISEKLAPIFSSRQKISYAKQAKLRQFLADFVSKNPLEFVGFVGADGLPDLVNQFDPPTIIWGLTGKASNAAPDVLFKRLPESDPAKYEQVAKGEPLTPLFSFKADPLKAIAAGLKAAGIAPDEAKLYLPKMLQPLANASTFTSL